MINQSFVTIYEAVIFGEKLIGPGGGCLLSPFPTKVKCPHVASLFVYQLSNHIHIVCVKHVLVEFTSFIDVTLDRKLNKRLTWKFESSKIRHPIGSSM